MVMPPKYVEVKRLKMHFLWPTQKNNFCFLLFCSISSLLHLKFDLYKEGLQNSSDRIKCTEWEFDMNDNLGNTWTSEWNLVCDKEYLKSVAEMFFLFGVATGGIISGYLSDKFGRRKMLFISVVFQTIFGEFNIFYGWICYLDKITSKIFFP